MTLAAKEKDWKASSIIQQEPRCLAERVFKTGVRFSLPFKQFTFF